MKKDIAIINLLIDDIKRSINDKINKTTPLFECFRNIKDMYEIVSKDLPFLIE